jgi:hypothetical protein
MAVSKSTVIQMTGDTNDALIKWSSFASGANNVYVDVTGRDVSKMIILVANSNSTDVGTTAGYFYVGVSASAAAGTSFQKTFSGSIHRILLKTEPPTTDLTEGLSLSSAGAHLAISAFGPFDGSNLIDSDNYINVCKVKATSDAARNKIAFLFLP